MRIALISDLHGNELAVEAVLADAKRAGYDQLVCLGDVATLGPRPDAVLSRLRALGCPCILGNHDEFMLDAALIMPHAEYAIVDLRGGGVSVDLRRVLVDRRSLAAQLDGWENALSAPLRALYAS